MRPTAKMMKTVGCNPCPDKEVPALRSLTENWSFQVNAPGQPWYPVRIPCTVLQGMYENGVIPSPYSEAGEAACAPWLQKDYRFRTTFHYQKQPGTRGVRLHFYGLCTLASVFLNGAFLFDASNMHREWTVDAELKEGENQLEVLFLSSARHARTAFDQGDISYIPVGSCAGGNYLRQAHSMFGWDWGPQLPDMGIWKEVCLEEIRGATLSDIAVRQQTTEETATIQVDAEISDATPELPRCLEAELLCPDGQIHTMSVHPVDQGYRAFLQINHPALWWPNGYGEQPLYSLVLRLKEAGCLTDSRTLKIGLRSLTVNTDKDENGRAFAFVVNRKPIFARGANYIPADILLTRINGEKIRSLLQICRDSHFNCIRVWGGGCYPPEEFYDLCDQYGILVWQDFMFACNTYRLDPVWEENVCREVQEAIKRCRNHPCTALFCGDNEIAYAWDCWGGFQDQPVSYRHDYQRLSRWLLPALVQQEAPQCFYWPSSPFSSDSNLSPNDGTDGDVHLWDVWNKFAPIQTYYEKSVRFCSEFGFQSLSNPQTLGTVMDTRTSSLFSGELLNRQKAYLGNGKLWFYLAESYPLPHTLEEYSYLSQVMQADALTCGIMAFRTQRPRCMGALYWQLNECWPGFSWSTIDYSLHRKLSHYRVKKAFAPVALHIRADTDNYEVFVCNETDSPLCGPLTVTVNSEMFAERFRSTVTVQVPPFTVVSLGAHPMDAAWTDGSLTACLTWQGQEITTSAFALPPNRTPLQRRTYTVSGQETPDGFALTLQTDGMARHVGLFLKGDPGVFSDNDFDLCTGPSLHVTVAREMTDLTSLPEVLANLKILDLNGLCTPSVSCEG